MCTFARELQFDYGKGMLLDSAKKDNQISKNKIL